jgi:hypothetical protein
MINLNKLNALFLIFFTKCNLNLWFEFEFNNYSVKIKLLNLIKKKQTNKQKKYFNTKEKFSFTIKIFTNF